MDNPQGSRQEFHTVRGYQLLEQENRLLTPAMEDYLEMICRNILSQGYARINTLSERLNVKPSSATKMVQKLAALELVRYEKYGIIFLTEEGRRIGEFLLDRHHIIETFLKNIGISQNLLVETELVEHNISANSLRCIVVLNGFFDSHPDVVRQFETYRNNQSEIGDCC